MSGAKSSSATATTGTAEPARPYRGRFAPSPSGALHFGSLVAAVGSCLEARVRGGEWLLRIEDLDPPRERPGAVDAILRTLDDHGFEWDGPVMRQSLRTDAYRAALAELESQGALHACRCTRAELAALPENQDRAAGEDLFHPPDCTAPPATDLRAGAPALRYRTPDREIRFMDRVQGAQAANVARSVGNFLLRRRDGLHSYQLAVVVDDAAQGVTDVVRGADLLASTPRQLLLQQSLHLPRPEYMHLPLAVDETGRKLSKSADAPALARASPAAQLAAALEFLRQGPPAELARAALPEVWAWARANWTPERFCGMREGRAGSGLLHGRPQECNR